MKHVINWDLFCDKESSRYNLSAPWIIDGLKVATDGRIILFQRTNEPNTLPGEGRWPDVNLILAKVGSDSDFDGDGSVLASTIGTDCETCNDTGSIEVVQCDDCDDGNCPECDGDGDYPCECCGQDVDCNHCDGTGECQTCNGKAGETRIVNCPDCYNTDNALMLLGMKIGKQYTRKIKSLPNARIRKHSDGQFTFVADGGLFGMIMAIKSSEVAS